jgi:adenosylhomocysteine nucleosidase
VRAESRSLSCPDAEVLLTGIGRRNAERTLRAALTRDLWGRVVSCGFAGGLNPALRVGDVLFDADEASRLEPVLRQAGARPARFHHVDRVIATAAGKKALWEATEADAVDMESAIIRQLCRRHQIPSATVRVISDAAHEDLPLDFSAFLTPDERLHYGRLLGRVFRSPSTLLGLLRLQRAARLAARRLADILEASLREAD